MIRVCETSSLGWRQRSRSTACWSGHESSASSRCGMALSEQRWNTPSRKTEDGASDASREHCVCFFFLRYIFSQFNLFWDVRMGHSVPNSLISTLSIIGFLEFFWRDSVYKITNCCAKFFRVSASGWRISKPFQGSVRKLKNSISCFHQFRIDPVIKWFFKYCFRRFQKFPTDQNQPYFSYSH